MEWWCDRRLTTLMMRDLDRIRCPVLCKNQWLRAVALKRLALRRWVLDAVAIASEVQKEERQDKENEHQLDCGPRMERFLTVQQTKPGRGSLEERRPGKSTDIAGSKKHPRNIQSTVGRFNDS